MKLSNETLSVLKNFSTINQGMKFKKGKKLSTVSPTKTVLAEAIVNDEITQEFCIYDLNEFLSIHSLYKDGEIVFTDSDVIFKQGSKRSGNYRKTAQEMIVVPPEKALTLPSVDCSFTLTQEDYESIVKATNILSSKHLAVNSDGEKINLVSFDADNDAAHTNTVEVGEGNGKVYSIVFKSDNIKLIPGTYEVEISFKGFAHFKNTKDNIQYWVAFENKETKIGE
jgi:hypothetical protein